MDARRAAITRSTRAGSATRRASGPRRPHEIDWFEPPKTVFDRGRGRLRPLVRRRRLQHLLQCRRPPCRCAGAASRRRSSTTPRSPAPSAPSPIPRCWTETQVLAAVLRDLGVGKGDRVILYMPMVPEAVIGMLACARIGAIHSVVFGGFARARARDPHRRRQAEGDPLRVLRPRAGPHRRLQAAARRGDRALRSTSRTPASSCSGRRRKRRWSPAATTTGREVRDHAHRSPAGSIACRSRPPIRSTSSTPRARPAGRRAWCATMAATWSRSNGR